MQTIRFFFLSVLLPFCLLAKEQVAPPEFTPDLTIMVPMSDGTLLSTDLYLPTPDAKNLPCILLRSPAGRKAPHWLEFTKMAKAGYVVAIQDTRSALDPEGKTFPFLSDAWGKIRDGYDSVEWLAKSPYTNGKIGTWGSSALGITQLLMAPSKPPALKCQYIMVAAASMYHHAMFPGGQLAKNQTEEWLSYYARDTGVLSYVCQRPFYGDFWRQFDTVKVADRVQVPGILIGGWYDTFLEGTLAAFASRQYNGGEGAAGRQKLIVGPWTHLWPVSKRLGDFDVPESGYAPPFDISPKRWFDHYLKDEDNGVESLPSVIYYVMGPFDGESSSGNVWRTSEVWPVPAIKTSFYLTPDFGLQEKEPFEGLLSYEYNPENVISTIGGGNLFLESGPKDQQGIEDRDDILVFTSGFLNEDVEVTGELSARLFFLTNQNDTDIVLRLTDVYPDGRSVLISEGIYRLGVMCHPASHAKKREPANPMTLNPDNPMEIHIDLSSTSIVFAKGHAIRLSVSSSNYPKYEKNLNVGLLNSHDGSFKVAKNTLYFGKKYSSELILPIVRKGAVWLKQGAVQNTLP
jgi:predicted acyl esterase